jgi:hypothetical protein
VKVIYEYDPIEDREDLKNVQRIGELISLEDDLTRYARHLRRYCDRESTPTEEVAEILYSILRGEWAGH